MTGPSSSHSGGRSTAGAGDDWGPSTAVRAGAGQRTSGQRTSGQRGSDQLSAPPGQRPSEARGRATSCQPPRDLRPGPGFPTQQGAPNGYGDPGVRDEWSPAGPASRDRQRANRIAERERDLRIREAESAIVQRAPERGLPSWAGLLVLIALAAIGGIIDTIGSLHAQGGFNIGIIVASVVAILIVKRSHMFPIVIAPPIVYSLGAAFQLYLRSNGLSDKHAIVDAASSYLVYGFPSIAAATAAVLIIAGIRLIVRK